MFIIALVGVNMMNILFYLWSKLRVVSEISRNYDVKDLVNRFSRLDVLCSPHQSIDEIERDLGFGICGISYNCQM